MSILFNGFEIQQDALLESLRDEGKRILRDAICAFLAVHPEVQGIRWAQYTPYWNDGDACEFGFNGLEVMLGDVEARRLARKAPLVEKLLTLHAAFRAAEASNDHRSCVKLEADVDRAQQELDRIDDEDDSSDSNWTEACEFQRYDARTKVLVPSPEYDRALADDVVALERVVSRMGDVLKILFDDHTRVTFMRSSPAFSETEFEHE